MKKVKILVMMLLVTMLLTGCEKSTSYGFKVDTGDLVIIKVDTANGYSLQRDEDIFIILDEEGTEILKGFFADEAAYVAYLGSVTREGCKIIEREPMEGLDVTQYQFSNERKTENNFICWIEGSDTGIIMSSLESQEKAEAAFDCLTIKVD